MKTREVDTTNGPVGLVTMSRAQFIDVIENTKEPTPEEISAAGAVSLDTKATRLNAASGAIAITLADGEDGYEKDIFFAPDNVASTAVFTLTGTFWHWTTLTFDLNGQVAVLRWMGGKWMLVSGNVAVA